MTKLSSCRPALCFNDCGKDPCVGLSSFSLSNVLGKLIVNYKGFVNLGRITPRHWPLKHIVVWQQVNQYRCHYANFAMRRSTASKGVSRRREIPKTGEFLEWSLNGPPVELLLGAMPPINPRGLNGPLTSHFIFSSHTYFSLNTPTHYWSPMPN